jgi:RNA chaperone Hfq
MPHRSKKRPPKKKPPQEDTGRERQYLNAVLKAEVAATIELVDGSKLEGYVASFGEESVELRLAGGKTQLLLKETIRTISVIEP